MKVSFGTAIKLGLTNGRLSYDPKTAYLLLGSNCKFHCSYCGINSSQIARVRWPDYPSKVVIDKLKQANFKRVCLQLSSDGIDEALDLVGKLPFPRSVCIRTKDLERIKTFFSSGADTVAIPLDAVTPEISRQVKRGEWFETLELLKTAANLFPKRIWTHLIIGLGEKEEETVHLMQRLHTLGVGISLFSFVPVSGTPLEHQSHPSINSYRRIQIARWLIENEAQSKFEFNSRGELVNFSTPSRDAFLTCGCKDCDRLYYDSSPTHPYNFPEVNEEQYQKAVNEAKTWRGKSTYKAEKLIRVKVEYSARITKINITGDFFLYPEKQIEKIERALSGAPVDKKIINEIISEGLEGAKPFGFSSEDLTFAIMEAIK
ncbi:MAG TPA: radical SAM protein [Thermoplasmata archaeon]|nr:radical SAM protein [Thermoplasmata archaeon]